jgi:cob(I)alamin adenosyltransferase
MTKFYTQTGDDGYTSLLGEGRVEKYSLRMEAVGTIDEASASLGIARSQCLIDKTRKLLLTTQRDLHSMMAEVSARRENASRFRKIDADRVTWIEDQIDQISASVKIPNEFIVPGDSSSGAALALSRTIVRRSERRIAELTHLGKLENIHLLQYINRLSSLCFVLELMENQATGNQQITLAKD